jgi:hypothetical protein
MMGSEISAMEITSPAMDEQSMLEPTSVLAQPDPASADAGPDPPADDWDLRALDVTAGEPD